jgi:hypothetical protein
VRQAGGAEHQGDAEADEVDLAGERHAVLQAGVEERLALAGLLRGGPEELGQVEPELRKHQHGDEDRAGHQQHCLDDLDPRGALHATHGHVEDHQQTDPDDREVLQRLAVHAQQQGDQRTGADHLREQVEDRHDYRRRRCGRSDRSLPHPVGQLVGERVAAGVAQQLGDEQQRHQPRDEEADGVEEPVVAGQRDGAGDAQERRGRHVVAGDRHAVLEAAERPAPGVVVGGAVGLAARPERDRHGEQDDREEQDRGEGL